MSKTIIETVSSPVLNESYYKIKHKSGLTILVHPMQGFSGVYALFATKFGSTNSSFKTDKDSEFITVPDGIAHFLEHKLFEGEKEDAFTSYSRTGASANAYTSFDKTAYLFSATDKIYESLEILLNFVTHPYFTDETVNNEMGIIGQEIRMYEDDPSWCVFLNLLKALYWNNPIKIDIAGTKESISHITPELLYKTYNTFYNLGNMVLSVAGNIDVDSVLCLADKILVKKEDIKIENKVFDEPEDVFLKKIEKDLEVSMPLFEIGFKEKSGGGMKGRILNEMLLEMLFSENTEFYQRLYNEDIINSTFEYEVLSGDGYLVNLIGGEAKDVQKVYDEIEKELDRIEKEGLDKDLFEIVKKQFYGNNVFKFNSVSSVASNMMNSYFEGQGAFDALDILSKISFEDICEQFKESFDINRSSISVINPIN